MLKPANNATWTKRSAAHLMSRAGFGGSPDQIDEVFQMGRQGAVTHLLESRDEPGRFPDPEWMDSESIEGRLKAYRKESRMEASPEVRDKARRQRRRDRRDWEQESVMLWLRRMHLGEAQAQEKMTLFWHGHFATSIQKVKLPVLLHQQNALFRNHALGNFKELTLEVCKDPAMMRYLDTDKNVKGKPNENFARELLELFTLGEGNYSEKDVKEAARAFTGTSVGRHSIETSFNKWRHDDGEKEFMGRRGKFAAEDIIDIIFEQPRCAEFLAVKLWEFFVCESPDEDNIRELADILRKSQYELKPALTALFLSEAFNASRAMRSLIKSPVQFLVQGARELELPALPKNLSLNAMKQLGQELYRPPNVAGWEGGRSWITTNTLLSRYNTARLLLIVGDRPNHSGRGSSNLPHDRIAPPEIRKDTAQLIASLTERFFHADLPEKDIDGFREYARTKTRKRLKDQELDKLIHLMLSTPQYQLA